MFSIPRKSTNFFNIAHQAKPRFNSDTPVEVEKIQKTIQTILERLPQRQRKIYIAQCEKQLSDISAKINLANKLADDAEGIREVVHSAIYLVGQAEASHRKQKYLGTAKVAAVKELDENLTNLKSSLHQIGWGLAGEGSHDTRL